MWTINTEGLLSVYDNIVSFFDVRDGDGTGRGSGCENIHSVHTGDGSGDGVLDAFGEEDGDGSGRGYAYERGNGGCGNSEEIIQGYKCGL